MEVNQNWKITPEAKKLIQKAEADHWNHVRKTKTAEVYQKTVDGTLFQVSIPLYRELLDYDTALDSAKKLILSDEERFLEEQLRFDAERTSFHKLWLDLQSNKSEEDLTEEEEEENKKLLKENRRIFAELTETRQRYDIARKAAIAGWLLFTLAVVITKRR